MQEETENGEANAAMEFTNMMNESEVQKAVMSKDQEYGNSNKVKLEGALQALCRTTARLPHLRDGVAACAVADQEVAVGSQACEAVRRDVYPEDWALWKRHCQG